MSRSEGDSEVLTTLGHQVANLAKYPPVCAMKAINAGAERFLPKPFSKQTLLEAIGRALARYSAIRHRRGPAQLASISVLDPDSPRGDEVCCPRQAEQAHCVSTRYLRTDGESASAIGDGTFRWRVRGRIRLELFVSRTLFGSKTMNSNGHLPAVTQNKSSRDLVEQAENLALADLDEPLHIPDLCRVLGVSDRTLRKAFHLIHGMPPCRHLRMARLLQARWSLLSADCSLVTVTDVATCFGFVELGRFSVEYRKVFGESPSETLHRAFPAQTHRMLIQAQ